MRVCVTILDYTYKIHHIHTHIYEIPEYAMNARHDWTRIFFSLAGWPGGQVTLTQSCHDGCHATKLHT